MHTTHPALVGTPGALSANAAKQLLASVGFLLVPGAPFERGPAYLMVALRPKPTLAHFDPERIRYWTLDRGSSEPKSLEWPMTVAESRYSWGTITMADRVRAHNEFASFGGRLTIARDGDLHAALFRSDAPILSIGGHSGAADPLGVHLAGFFGLLRAAAGDADTYRLVEAATPDALYSAFVVRTLALFQVRCATGTPAPRLASLLRSEARRLEAEHEADFLAGIDIQGRL